MSIFDNIRNNVVIDVAKELLHSTRRTLQDECKCNLSYIWYKRRRFLLLLPCFFVLLFWYVVKNKEYYLYTSYKLPWKWKLAGLQERWSEFDHHISSRESVFSAFVTEKNGSKHMTVLGLACKDNDMNVQIFSCHFWYSLDDISPLSHTEVYEILPIDNSSRCRVSVYKCSYPQTPKKSPIAVSLVNADHFSFYNFLPIITTYQLGTHAVCVFPVRSDIQDNDYIIEWFERNRIWGFSYFMFYVHPSNKNILEILNHYQSIGYVEIVLWEYETKEKFSNSSLSSGMLIAMSDCYLRLEKFEHIMFSDLWDILIPQTNITQIHSILNQSEQIIAFDQHFEGIQGKPLNNTNATNFNVSLEKNATTPNKNALPSNHKNFAEKRRYESINIRNNTNFSIKPGRNSSKEKTSQKYKVPTFVVRPKEVKLSTLFTAYITAEEVLCNRSVETSSNMSFMTVKPDVVSCEHVTQRGTNMRKKHYMRNPDAVLSRYEVVLNRNIHNIQMKLIEHKLLVVVCILILFLVGPLLIPKILDYFRL